MDNYRNCRGHVFLCPFNINVTEAAAYKKIMSLSSGRPGETLSL